MIIEIIKFFIYAIAIVVISKYILVKALRKLGESLNLKPRTVGNISGIATSVPEFLTVTISSFMGLTGTSLYNILSSNVINFIQYILSVIIHKNYKELKHKAIIIQLSIVILTILIPVFLSYYQKDMQIQMALIFVLLYIIFSWITKKVHEKYLNIEEQQIEKYEGLREKEEKKNNKKSYIYIIYIIIAGVLLYIVGNALGNVLNNLSNMFGIAEFVLGILLGGITSIPELITFFEAQRHYQNEKENSLLGIIEATNNLLTSNMLNLFIIQAFGILIYIWLW